MNPVFSEVAQQLDQVITAPTQPEEAGHHHSVTGAQFLQQLIKRRAASADAGDFILEDLVTPSLAQSVELGVQVLVSSGYTGVAKKVVHSFKKSGS
ncbi:hypothetical protein GCM10028773_47440 [Spirosoma koreense]